MIYKYNKEYNILLVIVLVVETLGLIHLMPSANQLYHYVISCIRFPGGLIPFEEPTASEMKIL